MYLKVLLCIYRILKPAGIRLVGTGVMQISRVICIEAGGRDLCRGQRQVCDFALFMMLRCFGKGVFGRGAKRHVRDKATWASRTKPKLHGLLYLQQCCDCCSECSKALGCDENSNL